MQNVSRFNNRLNFTFSEITNYIKKYWWLFLVVCISSAIAGVLYANYKKPIYVSRLTFALDAGGDDGDLSNARGIASQLGISLSGNSNLFADDNIIEIIMSRRIIERVLLSEEKFNNKNYKLIDYYLENSDKTNNKNGYFKTAQNKSSFSYDQKCILFNAYSDFSNDLISVSRPDKNLNLFQLEVTSFDEKFSKIFTDKLIAETDSFYREICTKKSKEIIDILEKKAESMKMNLNSSIQSKASSTDANLNPAFSEPTIPIQKEQFNIELYGQSYSELFKNLEIARFQYLRRIPLLQIVDSADYPMLRKKPSKAITAFVFSILGFLILICIVFFRFIIKSSANR